MFPNAKRRRKCFASRGRGGSDAPAPPCAEPAFARPSLRFLPKPNLRSVPCVGRLAADGRGAGGKGGGRGQGAAGPTSMRVLEQRVRGALRLGLMMRNGLCAKKTDLPQRHEGMLACSLFLKVPPFTHMLQLLYHNNNYNTYKIQE